MNSSLPKDCNCNETPNHQGEVCNNTAHITDEFFYNGENSSCTELENHDDITTAIQKIDNFLCSIEVAKQVLTYIENNINEFPDFVTLVNDALACETIVNCFTPESICFTVNTECELGNCPETFYVTPSTDINGRPSYNIEGVFEVFYNPALNRWESWVGMTLSSYLESNLFYPAGIWVGALTSPYISLSTNATCPTTTTTSSSTSTTTSTSTSTTSTSTSTTTTTSTSSSTTTTTTTAVPVCTSYVLEARITNASWNAISCETDELTGGILLTIGSTTNTGCVYDNSLVTSGMQINSEVICTTTTTSSTSTTTTSSTSTTTTTTTLYPCVTKQLLIVNNTGNTINDVYATGWSITSPTPVGPFTPTSGIQNGTNNAISVEIDPYVESGCISLYVNTVLIQSIPFYWSDVYTFDPTTITKDDCVWIIVNSGAC